MSSDLVRFIHASDFQLGRPLRGLSEVPDELRDRLIDAPRLAAQRVFETAILEEVDFILLSGNILDPRSADPRGMAFLLEQFEQLREHGIATYWAGGDVDRPGRWPEEVGFPDGVHFFESDSVEAKMHLRDDRPAAVVLGTSSRQFRSTEFRHDLSAPVTVAVTHANVDPASLEHTPVDYWALGGVAERKVLTTTTTAAQYAGSPQGNQPGEPGPHGCVLVRTGDGGRPHTQFVPTDVVRWHTLRVSASETTSRDELQTMLAEGLRGLAAESSDQPLLVCCVVETGGRLGARLRQEGLDQEVLRWLRRRLIKSSPPVWTVSLEAPCTCDMPEDWQEEDTILGDYLRAVEEHRTNGRQALDIGQFLAGSQAAGSQAAGSQAAGSQAAGELQSMLAVSSEEIRDHILRQAAQVGADLLRGDHV